MLEEAAVVQERCTGDTGRNQRCQTLLDRAEDKMAIAAGNVEHGAPRLMCSSKVRAMAAHRKVHPSFNKTFRHGDAGVISSVT
jgi:hypothetical protein